MLKYGRLSKSMARMYSTNYNVERIGLNEKVEVLKFMKSHAVNDEPLCKSLNILRSEGDKAVGLDYYFSTLVDNGEAYKIEDSGKILAVGLFSLIEKGKDSNRFPMVNDPAFEKILDFFSFVDNKIDIFKKFGIDKYYYTDCGGVHKDYRKLGLHHVLKDHSEERAKKLGCKYLTTLSTNAYSRRGSANCGMKEIFALKYVDYKVNGEIVFNTTPPHFEAVYYAKCLS